VKVLHVIPAVASCYGGPSAVLPTMCRALAREGVDATIATTDADGTGTLPVPLGVATVYQDTPAIFFRRQWSESFKYSKPLATWLRQNVAAFDLVHIHAVLSHACLAAGRACRIARVPYVVRPLGTLDPWSLAQKPLKKRALLRVAGERLLKRAAAIHYTSDEEKRLVESSFGLSNGVVIPLGVDDGVFEPRLPAQPGERSDCPYVLALSRLHPVKNLELLIESFARVAPPSGGWRLIIAGAGDHQHVSTLQKAADRGAARGRVEFPGWVEGPAKRALIENAALFAVPSLHENFGVALVEALACGVPALVCDRVHLAGAIRDADAGWVAETEPGSFDRQLSSAMASAEERRRRGEAAASLARRFAWSRVANDLAELYRAVTRVRVAEPCAE
jgi:glycosyltransferase involved in cell wall biosynthesis